MQWKTLKDGAGFNTKFSFYGTPPQAHWFLLSREPKSGINQYFYVNSGLNDYI